MVTKQISLPKSAEQLRILRAKKVTLLSRLKAIDYNIMQLEKLEKLKEVQQEKLSWWARVTR